MRSILSRGLPWGIVMAVAGAAVVALADTKMVYTIDPTRSEFVVQLFKTGMGSALAHDHVVRATTCTGQVAIDPAALASGMISVEVPAASLRVDEPEMRQKYGLASQLSDKDRQQIQETMQSPSQLDVARYPIIKFSSTKIEAQQGGTYMVTGNLTIRGVTQSVTFPAQVERRDNTLHVKGAWRFKQSSFGYQPYSALLGAVRNQDEVLLHFNVLATP
jgi:polyisoprenoid-binding protein YceI